MKQNYLFKTFFLLCALIVGSVSSWADDLTLDFESDPSAYTDWTFSTIKSQCTNSNVIAHGGSYYGGTDGKTSGSVTTANKIASPTSVQFYISKESTNTTASSWLVKVSTDGTSWTQVGDAQSASSGITRGTWTEVTRDLSAYSDVYVKIEYSGTTAKRCIDDVTITYTPAGDPGDPAAVTTVTIDDSGITNTNVFAGTAAGKLTATVKAAGTEVITSANVTWSSNNEAVATIDNDGVVTLVAAGTAKLTASYAGETDVYKASSAEYTLTVTNTDPDANDGSAEKPFTVAEAIAFIDAGVGLSEIYHVKGIISQVDGFNSEYSSITYWISDDGTTTNQLEVYSGKGIGGADFASVDDLKVNDNVVIKGKLKYYSTKSVYEFDYNNELVSLDRPTDTRTEVTLSFTNADYEAVVGEDFTSPVVSVDPIEYDGTITWKSSKESVATVNAAGVVTILAAGTTTITATAPATENYKSATASYVLTVTAPEPTPGEIANPYHYEFTEKQFAEAGTKTLANVVWTLATDAGFFGYDGTKGQQFGSSKAAATSLTLSTSQILGTITKVTVNTSGANSIAATFGVSVDGKAFTYDSEETASLTSTATSYSFVGSASGTIVISYTQTSSKAIYIKSIDVEYTAETVGIQAVNRQHANGEFFNLAGQRVAQPAKGLYIVNGKKVVVK